VTVADGIVSPVDTACAEGLMPDALAPLSKLGVFVGVANSVGFGAFAFLDRGIVVEAILRRAAGEAYGARLYIVMAQTFEEVSTRSSLYIRGRAQNFGSLKLGPEPSRSPIKLLVGVQAELLRSPDERRHRASPDRTSRCGRGCGRFLR
jgi:hypothetical protein